jgi:hypothetical protein
MNALALLFDPRFWLAVVLWTAAVAFAGYWKGGKDERADWTAKQMQAEREARETEQEITRMNNRSTASYVARVRKQEQKSHGLKTITLVDDCRVPADIGSVLNDARLLPEDAGPGSGTGAAAKAVDSTCAAELDIAKRNYAEVCVPNAEQLKELQQRWKDVQALINQQHPPTHSTSP